MEKSTGRVRYCDLAGINKLGKGNCVCGSCGLLKSTFVD